MATRQRTRKQKEKAEQEQKEKEQEAEDYLMQRRYRDGDIRYWSAESQERLAIKAAEERIRDSPGEPDANGNPLWIRTMRWSVEAMEELKRRKLEEERKKAELEEERRQIEEEARRQFEEEEEQRRAAEERSRELEISRACIREKLSRCEFPISPAARCREPDQQRSEEVEAPMEQEEDEQEQGGLLAEGEKTLEDLYEEDQLEKQRREEQKKAFDEKRRQREERRAENKLRLEAVETWLRRYEVHMHVQMRWQQEIFHEKIGPIGPQPEALRREIAAAIQLEKELEEHFGYPPPK